MLFPLQTSDSSVVAFIRGDPERPVLVIANLSEAARPGVRISTGNAGIAPGRYAGVDLLASASGPGLNVARNGGVASHVPLPTIAPLTAHIIELQRRR
jgi:hypothetical protein